MKKPFSVILSILLCVILLAGCGSPAPVPEATAPSIAPGDVAPPAAEESEPTTESAEEPTPAQPEPTEAASVSPDPEEAPSSDENTYTLSLPGFISVFDAPTYDGQFVRSIGEDGVYTIVEEKVDSEGFVWGKLKSGVGWICLSELEANPPVIAGLGSERMLNSPHHLVIVDDSEFMEYLVFSPTQTLTDVRLSMLLWEDDGYVEDSILGTQPELEPGKPLIAEVVFYGDFTTYGLSFKDAYGIPRHFAVYISGRNGAPVLQEYTPLQ